MENQEDFNELEWLKEKYFSNYTEQKIDSIKNFVLFWNIFESALCNKKANIPSIENAINTLYNSNYLRHEDFSDYLCYFQSRYMEVGQFNTKFDNLRFRENDREKTVRGVLKEELRDINNIVQALLFIIFRFRNNLFHGEKDIRNLELQEENFKTANKLLALVIDLDNKRKNSN